MDGKSLFCSFHDRPRDIDEGEIEATEARPAHPFQGARVEVPGVDPVHGGEGEARALKTFEDGAEVPGVEVQHIILEIYGPDTEVEAVLYLPLHALHAPLPVRNGRPAAKSTLKGTAPGGKKKGIVLPADPVCPGIDKAPLRQEIEIRLDMGFPDREIAPLPVTETGDKR